MTHNKDDNTGFLVTSTFTMVVSAIAMVNRSLTK